MSTQIIKAFPEFKREVNTRNRSEILEVSEFFMNTIQGEGVYTGVPAAFLRLQRCTLNCVFCDSLEVWRVGNPYTVNELIELMMKFELVQKLKRGHHLVITGGSPLRQQSAVISLLIAFKKKFGFRPFVEIENECVLRPYDGLIKYVDCWNNSPKLKNSGNSDVARYKPKILKQMSSLPNSWFKFVITNELDWREIKRDFIDCELIKKEQVILMPEGQTQDELAKSKGLTVQMAIQNDVRYCTREHIVLWNKKTGV